VLLAATLVFVVFVLDRLELGSPVRIRVYFAHTTGLKPHAPLVVAGRPVGRIETIVPVDKGRTPLLGDEEGAAAIIALDGDEAWKVPRNAQIFVSARGMFSERYLEVAPPPGEPAPAVTDGAELRGADPPALDSTLYRAWGQMAIAKRFAEQVQPEWQAFTAQLDALRAQLDALAAEVDPGAAIAEVRALGEQATQLRDALGDPATLSATLTSARATFARLRTSLDQLEPRLAQLAAEVRRVRGHLDAHDPIVRGQAVLADIRAALAKLDPLLAQVAEVSRRVELGEGSLGRLMHDPEFPEDAKELGKIIKRHPWRVISKPKD
jgi:ABC-type transporter Mla subunit MlaD